MADCSGPPPRGGGGVAGRWRPPLPLPLPLFALALLPAVWGSLPPGPTTLTTAPAAAGSLTATAAQHSRAARPSGWRGTGRGADGWQPGSRRPPPSQTAGPRPPAVSPAWGLWLALLLPGLTMALRLRHRCRTTLRRTVSRVSTTSKGVHQQCEVQVCAASAEYSAEYQTLSVPALKELLKTRKLPVSGRKADLVARLLEYDGSQGRTQVSEPLAPSPAPTATPAPPAKAKASGKRPRVTEEDILAGTIPFVRRTAAADFQPALHWKLISWNVNGLAARCAGEDFARLVAAEQPDVLCLQETKLQVSNAPLVGELPGYDMFDSCSVGRLGYSGTRTYVRKGLVQKVHYGLLDGAHNEEGRCITVELPGFALVNTYVPNAGEELRRHEYRTQVWDPAMLAYLEALRARQPIVWTGDLNVAERDYDRFFSGNFEQMQRGACFTPEERANFRSVTSDATGLTDAFRLLYPNASRVYSYWSMRARQRPRNNGWRLDYFVVSRELRPRVVDCFMMPEVMASDHCPIVLWLEK